MRLYCLQIILSFLCLFGVILHANEKRIIVLGFDGLDPVLCKRWMREGELPNLAKLAIDGTFCKLGTSNPAQSPVAWATFATGKNPGKHNIYGFLKHGENSYKPQLALAKISLKPMFGGLAGKTALSLLPGLFIAIIVWAILRFAHKKFTCRLGVCLLTLIFLPAGVIYYCLNTYLPQQIPVISSTKQGSSVWTLTGEKGIKTVVVEAPLAFPAERVSGGKLLCGFGVPDVAGTNGIWYRYNATFSTKISTETGGWKMPLVAENGKWHGKILGPKNLLVEEEAQNLQQRLPKASLGELKKIQNRLSALNSQRFMSCPLNVEKWGKKLQITIGDQSQQLANGQWSDWFSIPFSASPLLFFTGIARVRILSVTPPDLYMTPVQFHPCHLPTGIAISYPSGFAAQVADEIGLYPTLGWCEATNPLKDGEISEQVFWQDLQQTMRCKEKIFALEFSKRDWRLFLAFFYVTDRASHMYWRFIDNKHLRHSDWERMPQYRDKLLTVYRWVDKLVGKALKAVKAGDTLLVVSDHGFSSFRWGVNLNTWLLEHGYLVLKEKANRRLQVIDLYSGHLDRHIDWEHTCAYALGLGKIYINLKGRDAKGVVVPGKPYKKLCKKIRSELTALTHQGENVVHHVYLRDEIYNGSCIDEAPDIIVGFERGYRVSWQTTLGAVSQHIIEANSLKWSGDHCSVDPDLVPGVLFCNRKIDIADPDLKDIAPSILAILHIPPPREMEGRVMIK